MAFFSGLLSLASLLYGLGFVTQTTYLLDPQNDALIATTGMFVIIGLVHLRKPDQLTYMIANLMPKARLLVLLSGLAEIALGAGLLFITTRTWAAWGLIVLLIAIFPANINVAVNKLPPAGGLPAKSWYIWSRLLFQPVYILWIYYAALS